MLKSLANFTTAGFIRLQIHSLWVPHVQAVACIQQHQSQHITPNTAAYAQQSCRHRNSSIAKRYSMPKCIVVVAHLKGQ